MCVLLSEYLAGYLSSLIRLYTEDDPLNTSHKSQGLSERLECQVIHRLYLYSTAGHGMLVLSSSVYSAQCTVYSVQSYSGTVCMSLHCMFYSSNVQRLRVQM